MPVNVTVPKVTGWVLAADSVSHNNKPSQPPEKLHVPVKPLPRGGAVKLPLRAHCEQLRVPPLALSTKKVTPVLVVLTLTFSLPCMT